MPLLLNSSNCTLTWPWRLGPIKNKLFILEPSAPFMCCNERDQFQETNFGIACVRTPKHLLSASVHDLHGRRSHIKELSTKFSFIQTLLIDNYDSYTYNIYHELSITNGVPPVVIHNDEWEWEEAHYYLQEDRMFDNVVISPGPGSPMCPTDIGLCSRILSECEDVPILGVCLGHQALGYVHGACIVHAPKPVHGNLSEIQHNGCALFQGIPSGYMSGFEVVRYHSLIIDADTLPKALLPIAWTFSEDNLDNFDLRGSVVSNGKADPSMENDAVNRENLDPELHKCVRDMENSILMGIKHYVRPHYGVQFHPESISTRYGRQIFENFKKITIDYSRASPSHGERVRRQSWMQLLSKFRMGFCQSRLLFAKHAMIPAINNSNLVVCKPAKYVKLLWRKLDSLANKVGGSEKIFSKLFADRKAENTFWLDSSLAQEECARFSYMGGKGGPLWQQMTFKLSDKSGGCLTIEDSQGSLKSIFLKDGLLDFLGKELQSFGYEKEDYEELPFDFFGGYIGFIGYNLKVECGAAANYHKQDTPDACFFFIDRLVVIDHKNGDVYLLSLECTQMKNASVVPDPRLNGMLWLDMTEEKLLALRAVGGQNEIKKSPLPVMSTPFMEGFVMEKSREEYIRDVEQCQRFIRDGESYELCLTTQIKRRIVDADLLGLYLTLRDWNPSPYAAWLNFGRDNLVICCSSPERFLRLDRHGMLEAKPIKGTIARGAEAREDETLRMQLLHSEKDRAENLMVVDLLRNDLGRVCEPGTVHVPHLWEIESYATVHTMVSTICGKKRSDLGAIDCVRAAFPGGSMTGAPKLRSMEILDSMEASSRGIYSGSIGFLSYNQTFDLNIVIRTVVVHDGVASVGAGGAVIALSDPECEYEEMKLKAFVPAQVILENQRHLNC